MDYKLKFKILAALLLPIFVTAQTSIDFGSVNEKSNNAKSISYNSQTFPSNANDSVYAYFTIMGGGFSEEAYTAPVKQGDKAGGSNQVQVSFAPKQNVQHSGLCLVESENSVVSIVELTGQGTFSNSYYSSTRNKSEEALKTALNTLLNNGTVSLGYNRARDNMYSSIDNVGGKVECVYTGKKATFNTRSGANGAGFNCEHTYPQGFFSSVDPEKSDIHHLFPTTTTSNSRRGNDEFGVVSNASWQDGGSKSGGRKFEPRDVHKGAVARSMMYFVLRHGDFNDNGTPFLSKQESVLRQWHTTFAVSQKEKDRNDAIFALQKNRSPFVDYPQLLNRISKISGNSVAAVKTSIQFSRNLRDMNVGAIDTATLQAVIYNNGNRDVSIGALKFEKGELALRNSITLPATIKPNEYLVIRFGVAGASNNDFDDNLIIESNVPGKTALKFNYTGSGEGNSIGEFESVSIKIYPNPVQDQLYVSNSSFAQFSEFVIYDALGNKVQQGILNQQSIEVTDLKPSVYFVVVIENGAVLFQQRFVKQ